MNLAHTNTARCQPESPETPEVFVVDGDASQRDALELLIQSAGWRPRLSATTAEFLRVPAPATTPCCLLAELHLPGMSGLDLQRMVADRPEMPIIFMSGHADVQATVQAMKAGAFELLTKPFTRETMLDALARAIERSHATLRRLAPIRGLKQRCESLSRREREVMDLVVSGRMNKQVSGELGIAEITVKIHRGNVMRKMQAGSLAELVRMVTSLGAEFANAGHQFQAFDSLDRILRS